jgi:hypothetical protein
VVGVPVVGVDKGQGAVAQDDREQDELPVPATVSLPGDVAR